jgi:IS5 family transposase
MRKRFEQQTSLGLQPIKDVLFPIKSRDGLPSVLLALQYIFNTPSISEEVFSLLEKKIMFGKKKTGRAGMDLWHILVLAVVRHSCNTDWDSLETWANYNTLIRGVMGVHCTGFLNEEDKITFSYQTILDNVSLLDAALLQEINLLVVKAGHRVVKKKKMRH